MNSNKKKILFVTSELFPQFGYPTAGGGVRGEQIYRSLEDAGFPIDLALARDSAEGKDNLPDWATRYLYRPEFLDGLIEQADPDLVLSEAWEPLSHLKFEDNRIYVADCPGPLVLENLLGGSGDLKSNVFEKVRTLSRLDAVLCPTRAMRGYLSSYLVLAAWSLEDTDRILEVPIALPEPLPERKPTPDSELTIFVGGISWAWHKTSEWVLQLADSLDKIGTGKVRFRQGVHPQIEYEDSLFESLDPKLANHPRIEVGDLTDWNSLVEELTTIPLAIEWSPKHLEREIASTLRIVTYLWCGVPTIVRSHVDLAGEIKESQAGWVVDEWEDLIQLIGSLARDPSQIVTCSRNAQRLARERHTWPTAHQELIDRLDTLKPRPKSPSFLQHATETLRSQEEEILNLRSEIQAATKEMQNISQHLEHTEAERQTDQADAESFRAMRQKLPYRIWKRILG